MSLLQDIFGGPPFFDDGKAYARYEWHGPQQLFAEQFDKDCMAKALELRKDCPPEFNIMPTLELVRRARLMGLDVCHSGDKKA